MSDCADVVRFARAVLESGRPVDILVNNAGIIRRARAVAHSVEDWDAVLLTDLSGPFFLAQEFGRRMVEPGSGRFIFTASLLSFDGGINVVSYTAAKSGVPGVTKVFANERAPYGVTVNAIVPGYIATDVNVELREDADRNRSIVERIPVSRWGTPDDVASPIVFLASEASGYVTGLAIPVDRGWLSR
jgi:2-deoxy-D-gluconate 3-dehydrogenase